MYARIPHFWFLLGLLYIATGLYLGFEFTIAFLDIGIGFACCLNGVGIFVVRFRGRMNQSAAGLTTAYTGPAVEEMTVDSAPGAESTLDSAQ